MPVPQTFLQSDPVMVNHRKGFSRALTQIHQLVAADPWAQACARGCTGQAGQTMKARRPRLPTRSPTKAGPQN
jgi:hypothetical protein